MARSRRRFDWSFAWLVFALWCAFVFTLFRLMGTIDWSWTAVTSPLWGSATVYGAFVGLTWVGRRLGCQPQGASSLRK